MTKVHTIKFGDFMDGSYRIKKRHQDHKLYNINPMVMFDPTLLGIGAIVLSIAIIEKILERHGNYDIAEGLHMVIVGFFLPIIGFGIAIYLIINMAGVFL